MSFHARADEEQLHALCKDAIHAESFQQVLVARIAEEVPPLGA